MFHNILLPVDLADRHHAVLDIAAKLAAPSKGTVTLLHVIETISELSSAEERDFYGSLEATARSFLDRIGKKLAERGVEWRSVIVLGHRATETIRYGAEIGADLMIVTAPRIDPTNPTVNWGSLSFKISVLSQCPVLMVK